MAIINISLGKQVSGSLDTGSKHLIISGTGPMDNWEFEAYPLKDYKGQVQTVEIQDGVTYLGNYCFQSCSSMTSVTIPNSVTSLGTSCFSHCAALTSVVIPDSVTFLGDNCFGNCTVLASVKLSSSITSLGSGCFYYCMSLASITLPSGIISLGDRCFSNCALTSITIPHTVTYVGDSCFYSCNFLTSITNLSFKNQNKISNPYSMTPVQRPIPVYGFDTNTNFKNAVSDTTKFTWNAGVEIVLGANVKGYLLKNHLVISGTGPMDNWNDVSYPLRSYKDSIKTVVIEEGVTSLGSYCFHRSINLTSIILPDSLVSIGDQCFFYCTSLTSISILNSVTFLGSSCFSYCTSLTSIVMSSAMTSLGERCFDCCTSLVSITIPDSITSLSDSCFRFCSSLTCITIPRTVTSIGHYCFNKCDALTSITNLATSNQTVGSTAFDFTPTNKPIPVYGFDTNTNFKTAVSDTTKFTWNGPTEIVLGTDVKGYLLKDYLVISGSGPTKNWTNTSYPFAKYVSQIKTVEIEEGVTSLGNYCFYNCKSLISINIPGSVTSLDYMCFRYCTSLASITIPRAVTSLGGYCFLNCTALTSITNLAPHNQSIDNDALDFIPTNAPIPIYGYSTNVRFKDALKNTNYFTWNELEKTEVTTITFGENVTGVLTSDGHLAISGTGPMNDWADNTYPLAKHASQIKTVEVSDGITSLGSYCFRNCKSLTSINMPDSVTSIGTSCFYGCNSLSSVTMSNFVTSLNYGCFYDCRSLTSITIPDSVTYLGYYCFRGCSSLISVTIPKRVTSVDIEAFFGCTSLTSITNLAPGIQRMGTDAFNFIPTNAPIPIYGYSTNANFKYAVRDTTRFTWNELEKTEAATISLGKNVTGVLTTDYHLVISGTGPMDNWTKDSGPLIGYRNVIKTVEVKDGVTSLGAYCFYNCSSLASITMPDSVISIGTSCFYGCNSLSSVTISNSVTSLSYGCFYDCKSLTSITIPDSVTSLDYYCFKGCSSLISITIPKFVTSIDIEAFSGCTALASITNLAVNNQRMGTDAFNFIPNNKPIPVYGYSTNTGFKYAVRDATRFTWSELEKTEAATFSFGKNVTGVLTTDCHLVISGTGPMDNGGSSNYPLKNYKSAINTVEVQDGITSLGNYCFYECASLISITIPNSVTSIGDYCFYNCNSLTSVAIPRAVTSIGYYCFSNCNSLTSITNLVPVSQVVAYNAFDITPTNKPIPVYGYSTNTSFKNAVKDITKFTWNELEKTEAATISFGTNVTGVLTTDCHLVISGTGPMDNGGSSNYPLKNYKSAINTVEVQDGITSLGNYCFYECASLISITIPNSVTSIGDYCFYNCNSLTSIVIPRAVTSIGYYCFQDCNSLTSITNLAPIDQSIYYNAFNLEPKNKPIPVYGFDTNTNFKNAVSDTTKFTWNGPTEIVLGANVKGYLLKDHLVISGTGPTDNWSLSNYPLKSYASQIKTVEIQEGVTSLGDFCFSDCIDLVSITIPDSVTLLGVYCFRSCINLTSITIPDFVTSIGEYCFQSCNSLTSITIPGSITSIGNYSFQACISLTSITNLAPSIQYIGSNAFNFTPTNKPIPVYGYSTNTSFKNVVKNTTKFTWNELEKTEAATIIFSANVTGVLTTDGHLVISGTGPMKTWNDASYPLKAYKDAIKTVEVEDGVTLLGAYCFNSCTVLTSITIPDSVTFLGEYCFNNCTSLTSITIPNSVTSIGDYCFYICISLASITNLVPGIQYIGSGAFSLTPTNKPIPVYGYSTNTSFKNVVKDTTKFTWNELEKTEVATITFGQNVTGVLTTDGHLVISGTGPMKTWSDASYPLKAYKDAIKTVEVEDGVTLLGAYCFYNCANLTSITIPDSVTFLGEYCFNNCTSLTSITIPNSVTSLSNYCFNNCSALASITIPAAVTFIGTYCFYYCRSLTSITSLALNSQTIGSNAFTFTPTNKPIPIYGYSTNASFKNAVKDTNKFTWNEFAKTEAATIVFSANITGVLTTDCHLVISGTGPMKSWNDATYPLKAYKDAIKTVEIEDGVTLLGSYCFYGCISLISVTIPDSVTFLGDYCFYSCDPLISITIPRAVTSIGDYCFYQCNSLISVTNLATNSQSIGNSAFRAANKPTSVYGYSTNVSFKNIVKGFSSFTWNELEKTEAATIIFGTSVTGVLTTDGHLIISGTGPISNKTDSNYPLKSYKDAIKTVEIEDGVTLLGSYCFYNCANLTSITIPDSVTSLKDYCFQSCTSLTSIITPDSVTSLGNYCFADCTSLASITISDSVTSLSERCFFYCTSLSSITISDAVTSIGTYCFYACNSLASIINLAVSSQSIDFSAFRAANKSTSVYGYSTNVNFKNTVKDVSSFTWNELPITLGENITGNLNTFGDFIITGSGAMNDWSATDYRLKGYENLIKTIELAKEITYIGSYSFNNFKAILKITNYAKDQTVGTGAFNVSPLAPAIAQGFSANTAYKNEVTSNTQLAWREITPISTTQNAEVKIFDENLSRWGIVANSRGSKGEAGLPGPEGTYTLSDALDSERSDIIASAKAIKMIKDEIERIKPMIYFKTFTLGADVIGRLDRRTGELVISGTGPMDNWSSSTYPLKNYKSLIKTVEIEKGITSLGSCCFYECSALTLINIPNSITSLGGATFTKCSKLVSIDFELPCQITSFLSTDGWGLFEKCAALTSITIPNSVTSLGTYCFYNCANLTSVTISNSVTFLDEYCFNGCTSLTSITNLAFNDQTIGSNAFYLTPTNKPILVYGYSTNATFKNAVKDARYFTWNELEKTEVATISLGTNVTGILTTDGHLVISGTGPMNNWTKDSGPLIGYRNAIKTVEVKDGVTSLGNYCFYKCSSLISINIPNTVTSLGAVSFYGCSQLVSVDFELPCQITSFLSLNQYGLFEHCSSLTSITIPDSVTYLDEYCFNGCRALTSITIPKSVTSLGYCAFQNCNSLTSITNLALNNQSVSSTTFSLTPNNPPIPVYGFDTNTNFKNAVSDTTKFTWNGIETFTLGANVKGLLIKDKGHLVISGTGPMDNWPSSDYPLKPYKSQIKTVEIQNGVTSIGDCCFYLCPAIISVIIPDSVTSLGKGCFFSCTPLSSITVPHSVTFMGNFCFAGCSALTSINMPNSITSLSDDCFYACSSLTSISIPNSVTSLGDSCFSDCTALTSATIPNSVTSMKDYCFYNCIALTEIKNLSTANQTIGTGAFDLVPINKPIPVYGRSTNTNFKNAMSDTIKFTWNELS